MMQQNNMMFNNNMGMGQGMMNMNPMFNQNMRRGNM